MPQLKRRRPARTFFDECFEHIVDEWEENKELAGSWLTKAAELDEGVARRAFLMIYSRQTEEEQKTGKTFVRNHVGLNTLDALRASHLIRAVHKENTRLTSADLAAVRDIVTTYRVQILDMMSDDSSVLPRLHKSAVRRLIIGAEETDSDSDLLLDDCIEQLNTPVTMIDSRVFLNGVNVALRGALSIAQPLTAEGVLQLARSMNPDMFKNIADFDLHFRLFDILTCGKILNNRARKGDHVYVLWENEKKWHRARVVSWMPNGAMKATLIYEADNAEGDITDEEMYWVYSL